MFAYYGLVARILRKLQITNDNFTTKKIAIKAAIMTAGVKRVLCQSHNMEVITFILKIQDTAAAE